MAAKGYPRRTTRKAPRIDGLDDAAKIGPASKSSTPARWRKTAPFLANGGRVLNVCRHGQDGCARRSKRAYAAVEPHPMAPTVFFAATTSAWQAAGGKRRG